MKILVVDDDDASRHLTASILRSAGHEVILAADGVEALAVARADVPDALLSDILMPRMDGYQLAREWKADTVLSRIPIVFLTASYTDPADARFALDLGAERFLTKPVEPDVLLDVVAEISEGTAGGPDASPPRIGEDEILREYSERLVRKLEHKVLELQASNAMLQTAMDQLSRELEVKTGLISELGGRNEDHGRDLEALRAHDAVGRALDGAEVVAIVVDVAGTVVHVSRGAQTLLACSASEACGSDFFESFVPAEVRDQRRKAFAVSLANERPACSTSVVSTRRGDTVAIAWTDYPWRDENGDIAGIVGVGLRIG